MGKSDVNKLVRETMRQAMEAKETPLRELAELLDQLGAANAKVTAANDARTALIMTAQSKFDECLQVGWSKSELHGSGIKVPRPLRLRIAESNEPDDVETTDRSTEPASPVEHQASDSDSI